MDQASIKIKLEELIKDGYQFDIGSSISEGWELFKRNMGGYIG